MGTVYHAELRVPQGFARQVAVKVMRSRGERAAPFRARMRDEARLLGMLQDEHVLRVIELTQVAGLDCVIMEYVEGADLLEALQTAPVPPRALAELAAVVAGTLHRAHTARHPNSGEALNVIHRDVKPANLMVTGQGGVRLLDFGVARAKFDSRESRTEGLVLGTLNYFPPEVMLGQHPTSAVDIFGLALSIWECATGKDWGPPTVDVRPFNRRVAQRLDQLPESYGALVPGLQMMLAYEPEDRATGEQAETALHEATQRCGGPDLRAWARAVIPGLIDQRNAPALDRLVGQTLTLGRGGKQRPLEVIDPPIRTASGPEVMTYNDLAPPSAVNRVGEDGRAGNAPVARPKPRTRPWLIMTGAIGLGLGCGLMIGLTVLGAAVFASQWF